jgi:YggT family protein
MRAITQAIHFLITTIFDIFITLILLRFIFQYIRADFYNPISQAIVKLTNPALVPFRRLIPSFKGIDTAALVLLLSACLIKLGLSCLIQYQVFPSVGGLLIWSIGDLITSTLNIFFWAIVIQAIMSWVSPSPGHPVYAILYNLTSPLTQPARRYIKPISGIDVSPIVILLFLQVLIMIIATPIRQLGISWSI